MRDSRNRDFGRLRRPPLRAELAKGGGRYDIRVRPPDHDLEHLPFGDLPLLRELRELPGAAEVAVELRRPEPREAPRGVAHDALTEDVLVCGSVEQRHLEGFGGRPPSCGRFDGHMESFAQR